MSLHDIGHNVAVLITAIAFRSIGRGNFFASRSKETMQALFEMIGLELVIDLIVLGCVPFIMKPFGFK